MGAEVCDSAYVSFPDALVKEYDPGVFVGLYLEALAVELDSVLKRFYGKIGLSEERLRAVDRLVELPDVDPGVARVQREPAFL